MRFLNFITEDYEEVREYKKAIFDLKVEIAEKEFWEGSKEPTDPDKKRLHIQKGIAIKQKIIALKDKITRAREKLGEAAKMPDDVQELLDQIPDKNSEVDIKLQLKRERLGGEK